MTENSLTYILDHASQNGITIFVASFLFTLSLYHFLLYFQHKDNAYLYYSLYTFLTFVYVFPKAEHFFLSEISDEFNNYVRFYTSPLKWIYHTVYLIFAATFIDLKKNHPRWSKVFDSAIYLYSIILMVLIIHANITNQSGLMNAAYAYFYIPSIGLLSVITLVIIYSFDTPIKYYLIIGSIIYMVLSIISYYSTIATYGAAPLFFIAIFVESIFFALGLGAKQKKILVDRNKAQSALLKEHRMNIELQEKVKRKLDKKVMEKTEEILNLTRKNEFEHRRIIETIYQKRTLELRMRALQTQMNPHFLFNSLNSVKHFILQQDLEGATYFLDKLSKLIRVILENSHQQKVFLAEEIEMISLYLEVENIRLDNDIQLNIDIDDNVSLYRVELPPLVLQPFIENAIWHGLALKKGQKIINVNVQINDTHLVIAIEDNGVGRKKAASIQAGKIIKKESLGIDLTKQRLEAFAGNLKKDVKIDFEDLYENGKPRGTRVVVQIPLIT